MRHRVADLVGPRAERMWVSTFHSACVRILRAHGDRLGYKGSFTIYDDADSRRLVEIIARELDIDTKKMSPRSMLGQISQAKSKQQGPIAFRAAAISIFDRRIADVYDLYQQRMLAANAMDFDDLLAQRRAALRRAPRRARALPHPIHPHPHRRVPGHERRAERARRAAGRRPPQHRRGGGQRPVGLPVPGCRHLEHPRLRAGLPGRHGHHPGPELPLHPDHPRRRQRRHHQQRLPQAEDPVDRPGGGRPDRALPGRGRARRGRVGGPRDRPTALGPGPAVGRRRHLLPDQRPECRPGGGDGPGRNPLQGRGRHQVLRPQGDQGRPRLSPGPGESGRRGQLAPDRQRAQARRGRHLGGEVGRVRRHEGDLLRGRRRRRRRGGHRRKGGEGAGGSRRPARRAPLADGAARARRRERGRVGPGTPSRATRAAPAVRAVGKTERRPPVDGTVGDHPLPESRGPGRRRRRTHRLPE